jgi:hypothetical protein
MKILKLYSSSFPHNKCIHLDVYFLQNEVNLVKFQQIEKKNI